MQIVKKLIASVKVVLSRYLIPETVDFEESVLADIGMQFKERRPGVWVTQIRWKHGFPIGLTAAFQDEFVILMAEASIVSPVEWVSRKLALTLLAENDNYVYGSNRLVEGRNDVTIVHAAVCDSRVFDASHIAFVGRTVANQMVQLVTRLYAMDLITSTVEQTSPVE